MEHPDVILRNVAVQNFTTNRRNAEHQTRELHYRTSESRKSDSRTSDYRNILQNFRVQSVRQQGKNLTGWQTSEPFRNFFDWTCTVRRIIIYWDRYEALKGQLLCTLLEVNSVLNKELLATCTHSEKKLSIPFVRTSVFNYSKANATWHAASAIHKKIQSC